MESPKFLTRCKSNPRYQQRFSFHLDATHSFAPRQSAIDALNDLFSNHHQYSSPLLIGINTGMLANFAREGAECHLTIRTAIDSFLVSRSGRKPPIPQWALFFLTLSITLNSSLMKKQYSSFIKTLLDNLTRNDDSNLFQFIFFDMMRPLTLS
ncbi:DNA phosphorothioation-dependent restriction protein DptF [Escherichia coli]|uniref:DNA phosphorothioation-dependent restriction protein DptF n=1 Tax=Escherichia coli TaxID=562 RepID=UPI00203A9FA8|nr:DNA phosphorothioation-dependent restriction protein DptF [Escherichia coli]